jgi:hypothetical protein
MAASDSLSPALFHGTSAMLRPGDVIEPRSGTAYASKDLFWARKHASLGHHKDSGQGSLFGTVYNVEPMGDVDEKSTEVRSKEGFKVTGIKEFVPGDFYWKPKGNI